jgi:ferrous iron transport protein B
MDEAHRHGLEIDDRRLTRDLGVPVVPTTARSNQGLDQLLQAVNDVAIGKIVCKPHQVQNVPPDLKSAVTQLESKIHQLYPDLPNARWVALRLLDGDERIADAIRKGELGDLARGAVEETSQNIDLNLEVV